MLNSSEEIRKSNTKVVTTSTFWSKYLFNANGLKDVVLSRTSVLLSLFQCTSPPLQLLTLPHSELKKVEEEFRECWLWRGWRTWLKLLISGPLSRQHYFPSYFLSCERRESDLQQIPAVQDFWFHCRNSWKRNDSLEWVIAKWIMSHCQIILRWVKLIKL